MLIVLQKMSLEILDLQLSTRKLCIGGPEPPCHVGCGRADLQLHLKKKEHSLYFLSEPAAHRKEAGGWACAGGICAGLGNCWASRGHAAETLIY